MWAPRRVLPACTTLPLRLKPRCRPGSLHVPSMAGCCLPRSSSGRAWDRFPSFIARKSHPWTPRSTPGSVVSTRAPGNTYSGDQFRLGYYGRLSGCHCAQTFLCWSAFIGRVPGDDESLCCHFQNPAAVVTASSFRRLFPRSNVPTRSGGGTRTRDLRIMSPTRYHLRHPASVGED